MFILYSGGGSGEVNLLGEISPRLWSLHRKQAVKYLQLEGSPEAAELLERLPFELWDGTNSFGDEFMVLYLRIGVERYINLQLDADSDESRHRYRRIAAVFQELNHYIRFIAADVVEDETGAVITPTLATTSSSVERALADFETLMKANGATSGIDRIHTALHGYLIEICKEAGITHSGGADITSLFNLIRQQHPKFQLQTAGTEPQKILRGLAQVVDAMNPVRNHSSLAHPNDVLLDEPEAMLAANAVRSLLHYLNMKLR
jgi:Abortive infection C-terminus